MPVLLIRQVISPAHVLCLLCILWQSISYSLFAQSVPKERRITHREQSLMNYDPFSAEEIWKSIEIPPSPALSPEDALASFKMAPGFRVECVAAEPLVVDPVMFEFDPDGRIWAVEFRGWMLDIDGTGEGDPIGQVVVLEDTDGDTFMDKSTVFLDKLVMPRTVSFVEGGVLVAEPPHLWYCRDTDGDLKCDSKTLVGQYGRQGNPEHTDNGLMYALDNWMISANTSTRHRFENGKLIEQRTLQRGQWGMSQDDYGRLFYNYENRPLHADLFPAEYVFRNKHLDPSRAMPGMNVDVMVGAHEVFPIRVTPGVTLGGNELREDGTLRTFTIACGPSIYRGDQFPVEYRGGAVIPEAAGNLVRLNRIASDGVHLEATNAFDRRELLASTDERFRPVCSRTGPDGAVYICDLYRGIIEHVIYMMPYLRHQILSRGLDKPIGRGRIYRIVHEEKPLGPRPHMSGASSLELVKQLSHANGWWRDTAQRLLVERDATDAVDPLRQLARQGPNALGQIHALWTLAGIDRLDWDTVRTAIANGDAMVRSTAFRLSERFVDTDFESELRSELASIRADKRPMVRLQLLLTLGQFDYQWVEESMLALLMEHPDKVFRTAALSGLEGQELEFATRLVDSEEWTADFENASNVIEVAALAVFQQAEPTRVEQLLDMAATQFNQHAWQTDAIVRGILQSKLSRSKWPTPIRLEKRPGILAQLAASTESRVQQQAEKLLRVVTWRGDTTARPQRPVVKPLTAEQEQRRILGKAVYMATCFACHKENGQGQPGQAPPLAESDWVNGPPDRLVKIVLQGLHGPIVVDGQQWNLAMPALGESPLLSDQRLAWLLTYIRRAWDNYGDPVDPQLVAKVRQSTAGRYALWTVDELLNPDQAVAGEVKPPIDPLDAYRPMLSNGDVERGRRLFHTNLKIRCAACHKIGHLGGGFVGPNLTEVGRRANREQLLESLIVPSANIVKGYETIVIITDSGQIHTGTLISENDQEVVLGLHTGGSATINTSEIDERLDSTVSNMPPMANVFSVGEIADLVAYLESLRPEQ